MTTTFKIIRTALVAAPLALAAGMATAGGLAAPVETVAPTPMAPAPAPMVRGTDWSGLYLGGQLGYGKVTSPFLAGFGVAINEELIEEGEDFLIDDYALDGDFTGAVYGVHAGYMYDLGSIVLGAEIDYDLTSMKQDFAGTIVPLNNGFEPEDFEGTFEIDSILRLKARVGYDAGAFLPYVTGGVVRAELSVDVAGESDSQQIDGDFYGLGVAYKFSDSILVGGEVLQHKFYETDDGSISGLGIRATTATARVSFQF